MEQIKEDFVLQMMDLLKEKEELEKQICDYKIITSFLMKRENKLQQIEMMFKKRQVDLDKLYKIFIENH